MLQFINVEKRINDTIIFPSFTLTIPTNEIVAICSNVNIRKQLLEMLTSNKSLSSGEIIFQKKAFNPKLNNIAFFYLQERLYERLSIVELFKYVKRMYRSKKEIHTILNDLHLSDICRKKIEKLSFSEKKRVQLGCLLIINPDLYILEEPFQNLDLESQRIFVKIFGQIVAEDKSICFLTMSTESALLCSNIVYRLDSNGLTYLSQEEDEQAVVEAAARKPIRLEKIPTKVEDKIILFDPLEIDYIESNNGQSFLHINGESFPSSSTLNDLETRLTPYGFFRCHRSYIVNLQKVREVITWTRNSYSLILEDQQKTTIPLSKSKMMTLKDTLGI